MTLEKIRESFERTKKTHQQMYDDEMSRLLCIYGLDGDVKDIDTGFTGRLLIKRMSGDDFSHFEFFKYDAKGELEWVDDIYDFCDVKNIQLRFTKA